MVEPMPDQRIILRNGGSREGLLVEDAISQECLLTYGFRYHAHDHIEEAAVAPSRRAILQFLHSKHWVYTMETGFKNNRDLMTPLSSIEMGSIILD
jgi:hypothetical protein